MSPDQGDPGCGGGPAETAKERAERRRRLAEVFGEVLPEQTSDDSAEPQTRPDGAEEWLRSQVPPHHG